MIFENAGLGYPNADLIAVEDYIITPIVPNNLGNEMAGVVNE